MKPFRSVTPVLLLGALAIAWWSASHPSLAAPAPTPTPAPPRSGVEGPFVGAPVIPASFEGDVRRLPPPRVAATPREVPRPLRQSSKMMPRATSDATRQTKVGALRMPAPLFSFEGLNNLWGYFPPDPNGDVGVTHYVEAVNVGIGIFEKSTGTRLAYFSYNELFSGLTDPPGNPCGNYGNRGDPIALYDPISNRWILGDFAWNDIYNGPFYECIAVSKTSDPLGGWWLYALLADSIWMNDYPKLGAWADGIYMSANMYDIYSGGYTTTGVKVWALNRDDLISGAPLRYVSFLLPAALGYANLLPSNLRGARPPTGTPAFFASVDQPRTFHLWKFHMDWTAPDHSWFNGPTDLTVADFTMPCAAATIWNCIPQKDVPSSYWLDGLGDRLMMQLQYRYINGVESLWVNHTVAYSALQDLPTGIRWYEIRDPNGAPVVYQQGTFQPDDGHSRWMGSLAVDRDGNMALGYSLSSETMYPSIRYTGRLASDPLNVLPQGEASLIEGTGAQYTTCGGYPCDRWGDYSAMTVDPLDDCTFWYVNEYYSITGGNWQTRIGSFKFATCNYRYIFPLILNEYP